MSRKDVYKLLSHDRTTEYWHMNCKLSKLFTSPFHWSRKCAQLIRARFRVTVILQG